MGIYAIYRYVRRSLEKEVSHWRTLLVTVIFAIAGAALFALSGEELRASPGEPATRGQSVHPVWAHYYIGFAVVGLYFGVAYGAGEGDLREPYPGKLASLDALLAGKPFSANFARSMLAGGAFAGMAASDPERAPACVWQRTAPRRRNHGGAVAPGSRSSTWSGP